MRGNTYAFRVAACSYMHGCGPYADTSAIAVPLLVAPTVSPVSNSNLTLNVNWGTSAEATRYEIQVRTNGSWGSVINRGTSRNHSISASRGSRYAFRVRACDNSGCSAYSAITSEIVVPTIATPSAPSVSHNGFSIDTSWGSVSGATRYDVQVRVNGTWGGAINKNSALSHSVAGTRGSSYAFRVRACDTFGCTSYSSASSTLAVPTLANPATPTVNHSGFTLTAVWNSVSGAARYDLQVRTNNTWSSDINKSTALTHNVTGVRGSSYSFRVRACDSFGCNGYSSASAAFAIPTLAPPSSPSVSNSGLTLTASWGSVSGATRYDIQTQLNGTWGSAVNTGTTRTHNTSASRGNAYRYRVRACDSFGCTGYSSASSNLLVPTLATPSTPIVNHSGLTLTTSWGSVSGATRYDIQTQLNGTWGGAVNKGGSTTHNTSASRGNDYRYRVRACDNYGCTSYSGASPNLSVPSLESPSTPSVTHSGLTLTTSWGGVSNATRYDIQTQLNGTWENTVNNGTSLTRTTSASRGNAYRYRVRACDSFGCTSYSSASSTFSVPSLSIPTTPTVSHSGLTLTASWGGVSGATRYDIQTQLNGTWGSAVNKGTSLSHNTSAARGNAYRYRVRACDAFGCTSYSDASGELSVPTLAIPSAPTVGNSGATISANWSDVSGATRFDVQVQTNGFWGGAVNKGTALSHSITGTRGSHYRFRVRACDNFGCSNYSTTSEEFEAPSLSVPSTPTVGNSGLTLIASWGSVSGATRFDIQVQANGAWGDVVNKATSLEHSVSASRGQSYAFRVRACDTFGCTGYSTPSSPTDVPTLGVPQAPAVSHQSGLTLTSSWGAVSGASRYDIQSRVNGSWGAVVNAGATLTHTANVGRGSRLAYRVRACDTYGCESYSAVSTEITIPMLSAALEAPEVNQNGLLLSGHWGAIDNAERYEIQVSTDGTWGSVENKGSSLTHEMTAVRGKLYAFRVRPCDAFGCAGYSPVSVEMMAPVLAAPTGLSITSDELITELNWGSVVDAERYEIEIRTNGSWGSTVNRGQNRHYDFEGSVGASYRFRVRACDATTCSVDAESDTKTLLKLAAPAVNAEDAGSGAVQQISITSAVGEAIIRYTLDDSPVTELSAVYTHPLTLRAGVIRARAYGDGWVSSDERRSVFSLAGDQESKIIYIHSDILGSVIGESDEQGEVTQSTEYLPFGKRREQN
ncbi:MAG: chitobiase/beta-hexosaminidase C-terminal domain-containing protein [Idiomarina sp.]|nr:chitobiase/beta-hexosaminidase C-terminal domain-containing protein [Idiomarina sp.]